MKLCVVGRSERMGLGTMTVEFARNIECERVVIVDCGNGRDLLRPIGFTVMRVQDYRSANILDILGSCDTVVGFESWYRDDLAGRARAEGVKSVMFHMWEWSPPSAYDSDVVFNLSRADDECCRRGIPVGWPQDPLPANPAWPPKRFLHLAGNASHNREGTREVIRAAAESGVPITVRASFEVAKVMGPVPANVTLEGPCDRRDLFLGYDCLVQPRRIRGHSLPIDEATAAGLPVVTLDLDEWSTYPYRCPVTKPLKERWGRKWVDSWSADVPALSGILTRLQSGMLEKAEARKPQTWEKFKESFYATLRNT